MGLAHQPRLVTDGLVFFLDAANERCYPGTGLTANGLIGGIGGTLVNGVGFSSLNSGSFFFDGTNDYIDCGNFADNLSNFSVMAWHKTSKTSGQQMVVAKLVNYSSGAGWALITRPDSLGVSFLLQTNGSIWYVYSSYKIATDNSWHHIAAIISSKVVTGIYVDGTSYPIQVQGSGTIGSISNSVNVRIGRDEANEYIFQDYIPHALIYNRVLTDQEIKQNYNATKTRYGR